MDQTPPPKGQFEPYSIIHCSPIPESLENEEEVDLSMS